MIASISSSTLKQYNRPIKLWWNYCRNQKICPYTCNKTHVLEFLSSLLNKINTYSTLNCYRSALSLINFNGLGNDADIKRFCKGVSVMKPSRPKYNYTWDPITVIKYLASYYPNSELSLEKLTKKLVTLLALITAQRVQTLSLIKIKNIKFTDSFAQIFIDDRIKTTKINKLQPLLEIPIFREQENVCVYSTLKEYIQKTAQIRKNEEYLILTIKSEHKKATTQSISRWIKSTLEDSGIDTNIFSAHSTRHAATSAAKRAGLNIEVIRKAAGWCKNSEVFEKFYNRPTFQKGIFANSIMNST